MNRKKIVSGVIASVFVTVLATQAGATVTNDKRAAGPGTPNVPISCMDIFSFIIIS